MALIRIQGYSEEAGIFQAKVSFDQEAAYGITVRDPFSKGEEERLEWYFEEHFKFPFTDQVKAQEAAASITTYGEKLFAQVFSSDPEILSAYRTAAKAGLDTVQIEIVGQPSFQTLHWEALKDPELPRPLALQATMVRKSPVPQELPITVRPSPTINLLVVTARPGRQRDVGYRTISEPLLEALSQTEVPVRVDILRPGTYKSLENQLREITNERGAGYYHVVHFDVHGSLLTYEEFRVMSRSLGKQREDRLIIQPYEGLQAFLAMEAEQEGAADLVGAQEVGTLLMQHQIPITVLNACESGKQVGDRETSLGSHLLQTGIPMVVAMGYTVTVSTAKLLMRTLYEQLMATSDLSVAICHARRELYAHKARRVYFDQQIDLEDWLLPVVYQSQPQRLRARTFTPEERQAYSERQRSRHTPPQPSYGFVGRDLDILQIERCLLTTSNILLVRGMGGVGKTALLQHLASWWQRTGFVDQIFFFSYQEGAWTRQQVLMSIAKSLLDEQRLGTFQSLGLDAQQAMLAEGLRDRRHLLILDGLESIAGTYSTIQHTLSAEEQARLGRFLNDLVGGRTLIIVASRSNEAWLAEEGFEDNVYNLQGLDFEAASLLAERILERQNATRYLQEVNFQRLLNLLDGFPLALEAVLTNLSHLSPTEVLTALQTGAGTLNLGNTQQKREIILHGIDNSPTVHSYETPQQTGARSEGQVAEHLAIAPFIVAYNIEVHYKPLEQFQAIALPAAQALLICLAPFTSVVDLHILDQYMTYLRQQPALTALPFQNWPGMLREAANCGLLSPHPAIPRFLQLQPLLCYLLRTRLRTLERAEVRRALEAAFCMLYEGIGAALLGQLGSEDPNKLQSGRTLAHLEYENLMTALNLTIAKQASIFYLFGALSAYLDATFDQQRGLELSQTVLDCLETYPVDQLDGQVGIEFAKIISEHGYRQIMLKQYAEAEASYLKKLALAGELKHIDENERDQMKATAYHELGIIAQEQQQWDKAEQYYQQALHLYVDLNDRRTEAGIYNQLGMVAQGQHEWVRAEQYYRQALQAFADLNDRRGQGVCYQNLGGVAAAQQQWDKAQQDYQRALHIFSDLNDQRRQADIYHNLGTIARKQKQWDKAQQDYQRALTISIDLDDRYAQAQTYYGLGEVSREQRQWAQAEQYFHYALQTFDDYDDRLAQASTYDGLGKVAQAQQQWDKAQQYLQQALHLYIDLHDRRAEAETHQNLSSVAKAQQQWAQAEQYYRNLSPETRQLLSCLAPFTTVIDSGTLEGYTMLLCEQLPLATLPFERWPEVLQEGEDRGLLKRNPRRPNLLHLQPILAHFLRSQLNSPEQREVRRAVEMTFHDLYALVSAELHKLLQSKDPHDRDAGKELIHQEYDNLQAALNFALTEQTSVDELYNLLSEYLAALQDHARGLQLAQTVFDQLMEYSAEKRTGSWEFDLVTVIDDIATWQWRLKDYIAAEKSYQKALQLVSRSKHFNERESAGFRARIYHGLGIIAQEQRRWTQAEESVRQALQLKIEAEDRQSQATSYQELARIAQEQQQWTQAGEYYQLALGIHTEFGDRYGQAKDYHELGIVSKEQQEWSQAEAYYRRALQIYTEFGDRHGQAKIYHELGTVFFLGQQKLPQAEEYYQLALQMKIEVNDRYGQANTCHQLGFIAQHQQQWTQAEEYYWRAIQIRGEFNDRYAQAGSYLNLGIGALIQYKLTQARDFLLHALEIFVDYGDTRNVEKVFPYLVLLSQISDDEDLSSDIASILGVPAGELEALLSRDAGSEGDQMIG